MLPKQVTRVRFPSPAPVNVTPSLLPSARLALQLVDTLGRIGLGQAVVEFDAGFFAKRHKVTLLGAGHLLVAGGPVVGILLGVAADLALVFSLMVNAPLFVFRSNARAWGIGSLATRDWALYIPRRQAVSRKGAALHSY